MNKKILIAIAWPYVNGDLHVGHLAGYLIPADIQARFQRLVGNDVLMVSGSDCHGTPITVEADKRGVTPEEIVEQYHKRDVELFEKYRLSYNLYTKTTTKNHEEVVQELFLDLLKKNLIIKKTEKQYYSKEDNKFLPDRYVEGECSYCGAKEQRSDQCESCGRMLSPGELNNPYSKLTNNPVTLEDTQHYYLDLSKLSDDLEEYIESKKDIWRKWIFNEAKGWIKEGLKPRAITRDLDWGIDLPIEDIPDDKKLDSFEDKRLYVWFEAVTGYLSAPQEWSKRVKGHLDDKEDIIFNEFPGQSHDWKDWWLKDDSYHYYFLGQDNVVFHTILWPGQLLGAEKEYNLPDNVAANKFMNYEGKKFSKSRNWIIDSNEIADKYGVDPVRFYISLNLPENKEGNFSWEEFYSTNNNLLVANIGNLINRTLIFLNKKFEGKVPQDMEISEEVKKVINDSVENYKEHLINAENVKGLKSVLKLSSYANKYFNDSKIWETIKSDQRRAEQDMYNLCQIIQIISKLIYPFLPDSSDRLRRMLNLNIITPEVGTDFLKFEEVTFTTIDEIKPLFKKLETKDSN